MNDRTDHLSPEYTNPTEVEDRLDTVIIKEDFKIGLDQTAHTEVGQDMILTIEVATGIIQKVVRGVRDQKMTVIEGETLEVKIRV